MKCHVPKSKRYRRAYNGMIAAGSLYQTIAHAWIGTSWHRIMIIHHEKDVSTSQSMRTKAPQATHLRWTPEKNTNRAPKSNKGNTKKRFMAMKRICMTNLDEKQVLNFSESAKAFLAAGV